MLLHLVNLYRKLIIRRRPKLFPVLLLMLLCCPSVVFSQQITFSQFKNSDTVRKSALDDTMKVKKRFGRSAILLGFAEITPWSIDRFIRHVDYTQISWKTVGHNLNPGSWAWDNDDFQTNQFGHPYHGSYFFNAFRTNGYTFWQSVPAAFAGSYLWETFAENQAPAPNDFINTGFGGVILGETTYRISNRIINPQVGGFQRQMDEVFALLIDPMNGLTRLLDGKWGKVSDNANGHDTSKVSAEFDVGTRRFYAGKAHDNYFGWYGSIKLLYGSPYEGYRTPFSNIYINTEFGQDDSSKLNIISVYGSLAGWELEKGENPRDLAILSANYDFIHNAAFFYGGQSVKLNIISRFQLNTDVKLNTTIGAGPVVLAAVPDPYLYRGRNYDYGPGFAINASGNLSLMDKLFCSFNYRGGWMQTLNGNTSHYFLHTLSGEVSYMMVKDVSVCAEPGYFTLRGYYKNYPNVYKNYPYLRLSARYTLDD
jgi:hypothetical protein